MSRVFLERNGLKVEADLSLEELKELMGLANGAASSARRNGHQRMPPPTLPEAERSPEVRFERFLSHLKNRGRTFFDVLKAHPLGIEAGDLAQRLGFNKVTQIGGLIAGGALAFKAQSNGFTLSPDLYYTKITVPKGVRTLTYYPGEVLLELESPHE